MEAQQSSTDFINHQSLALIQKTSLDSRQSDELQLITELEHERAKLTKSCEFLSGELQQLWSELERRERETSTVDAPDDAVVLVESTNRALNRRVCQLKEEVRNVGQLKRQLEKEREYNTALRAERDGAVRELATERETVVGLRAELAAIRDEKTRRMDAVSQTTLTMQSLRAKRKQIEEKRKESEETRAELESTKRATAELQTALKHMKVCQRSESKGSQTEPLEEAQQITRLREELGQVGVWLGETTEKLDSERRVSAELRRQLDSVQPHRSSEGSTGDASVQTVLPLEVRQVVALKSLVKRLKDELSDAHSKLDSSRRSMTELKSELNSANKQRRAAGSSNEVAVQATPMSARMQNAQTAQLRAEVVELTKKLSEQKEKSEQGVQLAVLSGAVCFDSALCIPITIEPVSTLDATQTESPQQNNNDNDDRHHHFPKVLTVPQVRVTPPDEQPGPQPSGVAGLESVEPLGGALVAQGERKSGKKRRFGRPSDEDGPTASKVGATPAKPARTQTRFVAIPPEQLAKNGIGRVVTTHQGLAPRENGWPGQQPPSPQANNGGKGVAPVKITERIAELERRFSQNDEEFLTVMNDLRPLTNRPCSGEGEPSQGAFTLANAGAHYAEAACLPVDEIQLQQLMLSQSSNLVSTLYNYIPQAQQSEQTHLAPPQPNSQLQQLYAYPMLPNTPPFHSEISNSASFRSVITRSVQSSSSHHLTVNQHPITPSSATSTASTTAMGLSAPMTAAASAMAALAAYQTQPNPYPAYSSLISHQPTLALQSGESVPHPHYPQQFLSPQQYGQPPQYPTLNLYPPFS